jgi:cytidyltransferase-like protein
MKVVYIDMVGDLFHYGHVQALKQSKDCGDYLIVGVHNDCDVNSYKRTPVMTMEERVKVIEGCKYVNRVVGDAPLQITQSFLDMYNIDIVCITDSRPEEQTLEFYGDVMDKVIRIKYTSDVSTTDVINRIRQRVVNKNL